MDDDKRMGAVETLCDTITEVADGDTSNVGSRITDDDSMKPMVDFADLKKRYASL